MNEPSKEQFYKELNEYTFCGYEWCRKLYGYSKFEPKFLERVCNRLDELGRSRVKYVFGVYFKTQMDYESGQMKYAAEQEREARKNRNGIRSKTQFLDGLPQDW